MMNKRRCYIIISLFLSMFLFSYTQAFENNSGFEKISITEAVRIAMKNNQDYKIAVLKEKKAREKVKAVWGQLMPVLESEASLIRQNAENGFMSLSDGQNEIRFIQMKFGLNPGIFYNSLKASKDALKIAQEDARRIKSSVEYSVIKGYFDVLLSAEIIKLQQESIDVLNSNLRDVQNKYKSGTVPKFELLQAKVEVSKHDPMLLEAKNNNKVAIDMFNYILGSDELRYIPDERVLKDDSMKEPEISVKRDEYLINLAIKNRPEIIQLETSQSLAVHSKNLNSSYYLWPVFSVAGYYGKTQYLPNEVDPAGGAFPVDLDFSQLTGTDEWQNTWQIRVAATYRWGALSPADPVRAAEREDKIKIEEAEKELHRLKRLIGISIRSNYSKLVTAYLTVQSQKESVITAEEGMRVAKESYRAGVIKNSELLSAEFSLNNTRTSYIKAIYNYYIALAGLKKDIGIDDERIIVEGKI
ncbi:MAG: TolC family protein [Spirochaetes bacterium]|nr:TolC family protein [Spirochaetota bacterium]